MRTFARPSADTRAACSLLSCSPRAVSALLTACRSAWRLLASSSSSFEESRSTLRAACRVCGGAEGGVHEHLVELDGWVGGREPRRMGSPGGGRGGGDGWDGRVGGGMVGCGYRV
eukprot:364323-Chlamydomonas_euryale.AAC.28